MKKILFLSLASLILFGFLLTVKVVMAEDNNVPNWNITGEWTGWSWAESNSFTLTVDAQDEEGNFTGNSLYKNGNTRVVTGKVSGDNIKFEHDGGSYRADLTGVITANKMEGTFVDSNDSTGSWELVGEASWIDYYKAAPDVANYLLEKSEINPRYGSGRTGGNYISDVARHMGPGTDFEYPEGNIVNKHDVEAYEIAIVLFLRSRGANVGQDLFEAVLESVVYEGTCNKFGSHVDDIMIFTFSNNIKLTDDIEIDRTGSANNGYLRLHKHSAMEFTVSGNILTVKVNNMFSTPRDLSKRALVEVITGLNDLLDNPVIVPDGGVEIEIMSKGEGVIDYDASGAISIDNNNGTLTLQITLLDFCGNSISGLDPLSDFHVIDSVISGKFYFGTSSIPGSNNWEEEDGVYTLTLERNFFNARPDEYDNGWYRVWNIYVKDELLEKLLPLETTYYSVGDWKMNLNENTPRFITIESHEKPKINGIFGIGHDPKNNTTGTIEGYINGNVIYMFYKRTDIETNYTAEFNGVISSDGNSMSGTWTSGTWYMERQ